MNLNSEGIQKKEFHIVFKGYKPEEVDKFLDLLSMEFDGLQKKIKKLEEGLDSLKYEGDKESSKMKTVIQEALISAHRVAEEIKQKARVEAEEMVSKKRMKEEQELNNLKNEKESIKANISGLKIEYNDFKDQISKFADDLKQKTLNFKNGLSLNSPKIIDFKHTAEDRNSSDSTTDRKEEENEGKRKDNIGVGTGEESNKRELKGAKTGDIEEKEDNNKNIDRNELEDLAALTDEMFEKLNRKEKTGADDKKTDTGKTDTGKTDTGKTDTGKTDTGKTDIEEPDESNYRDDSRKTNRKKIDIANPDIINDFFNLDED